MKRFTKMLALGLAAVLVFGMSVQAAPSINTSLSDIGTVSREDVKVEKYTDTAKIKEAMSNDKVLENLGEDYQNGTKKVEVVGSFDLTMEDSAKGQVVTVAVADVKENHNYKLFHFPDVNDLTKYEVMEITGVADGNITFKLGDSASPFVLVDMGEKAPAPTNPPSNDDDSKPQETSPAVAPKTGETVPVAGIMALVLMAGAVLCAKKARYNR